MDEKRNEIILFKNQGVKLEVNLKDETVWLNLEQMSELFKRDKSVISRHIKNALVEELSNKQVVAKFATTTKHGAIEGKTQTHNEIKKLLMSMRTADNEGRINNLLGKIDLLSKEKLASMIVQIGEDEESIKRYLQEKLNVNQENSHKEHTQINEMFTYGISGRSIHLHMPVDLHQMMSENGITKTIDTVNLYLLDAIERIRKMQNDGYYKFNGKDNIYMISPILSGREMNFLKGLDFKTQIYKKKELQDKQFVETHPEAQLATRILGQEKKVGTAIIGIDIINSNEWQKKRVNQVETFKKKGIMMEQDEKNK